MTVTDKKMRHLGRRLYNNTGDGEYQDLMEEQHRLLMNHCANAAEQRRNRPFLLATSMASAAATTLVILLLGSFQSEEIPFRIDPGQINGQKGSWVEAPATRDTAIHFEGGSHFLLRSKSAARVIEANTDNVIVDLSHGELHCDVTGNGKTRWIVRAGTYQVTVTGTSFTVSWTPGADTLNVFVSKGSVLVSGAALKPHGMALSKGDHLTVDAGKMFMANENTKRKSPRDEPSARQVDGQPPSVVNRPGALPPARKSMSHDKQKKIASSTPLWKKRYAQKDYAGAMAAAKSQGLDHLSQNLNADDLWQLSKAARFALDGAAAHQLLFAVTTRFSGSSKADNATFLLGRVSEELLKKRDDAKQWYERYLAQGKNSKLSEASLGRLIGVCQQSGLVNQAKSYAKKYLSLYPEGLFAKRARVALQK